MKSQILKPIFKFYDSSKQEGDDGIINFTHTTRSLDRDKEVVLPAGVETKNIRKDPVFLWSHDRKIPAIGRIMFEGVEITKEHIKSPVLFHFEKDPFADLIYQKYLDDILHAVSISFIPLEQSEPIFDGQLGPTFSKSEWLETSAVNIPSNPEALENEYRKAVDKSYKGFAAPYYDGIYKYYQLQNGDKTENIYCYMGKCYLGNWEKAFGEKEDVETKDKAELKQDDCECKSKTKIGFFDSTATELPKPVIINGYFKSFDVDNQTLEPSQIIYDWAAKFCDCKVKELYVVSTSYNWLWKGSFLSAFQEKISEWDLIDTRRITESGKEVPPEYEMIELNSKETLNSLKFGTEFREIPGFNMVITYNHNSFSPRLIFYVDRKSKDELHDLINETWREARDNHKMKGEAFSLTGEFLKRQGDDWNEVFLPEKNRIPLQRSVRILNERGALAPSRGLILMGPPGTGKTLSGRIMLNQAKSTFIWLSAKDFWRSGGMGGISRAFEMAKLLSPSIVFIEDVDNYMTGNVVDLMKTEMDGIDRVSGVTTILTTNYPDRLPDALIDRPGRFHDVLEFDFPAVDERKQMLQSWANHLDKSFCDEFAKLLEGYSGAHIYELVQYAKTIKDEDGLSDEAAFRKALKKIQDQRDLIDQHQLAGSTYRPSRKEKEVLKFREVQDSLDIVGNDPDSFDDFEIEETSEKSSILPSLISEINGSYEWAIRHLKKNAKDFSIENNSIVGFRSGIDSIEMVATFENKGIFVVMGQDRSFSDDPVFRANWEMKDGVPVWRGTPKKVRLSIEVRRRAYDLLNIEKEFEKRKVVAYAATSTLSQNRAWDDSAAQRRLRRWASTDGSGSVEQIDWAKYRRGFAWYDRSNEKTFDAYKLPHHDVDTSELKTHWRGTSAAMSVLLGARGGVDVPGSDRQDIYDHLSRHYAQYDKMPPQFRDYSEYKNVASTMIELQNFEFDMIEVDRKDLYLYLCEKYSEFDKNPPEFRKKSKPAEAHSEALLTDEQESKLTDHVFELLQKSGVL